MTADDDFAFLVDPEPVQPATAARGGLVVDAPAINDEELQLREQAYMALRSALPGPGLVAFVDQTDDGGETADEAFMAAHGFSTMDEAFAAREAASVEVFARFRDRLAAAAAKGPDKR
jgi:hypothetical protein